MAKIFVISRVLALSAAAWAVLVSLYFLLTPIPLHTIPAAAVSGASESIESAVITQSWYQVQGLWGTVVLLLFAGFYVLALYLIWHSAVPALIIMSLAGITISYITGFSIGLFYLPSALALLLAASLLWISRFNNPHVS